MDSHTTGHDTTPGGGDATRQDATGRIVSVSEAAAALNVTPDAIRARLRRGSLKGEKRDGSWYVRLPEDPERDTRQGTDATQQDTTGHATPPAGIDLAPLVQLVDDLTRRNADLSAAAALWQSRAAHLEERIRALEAGPTTTPDTTPPETSDTLETLASPEAPGSPGRAADASYGVTHGPATETPQSTPWGRLWRALRGG